MRNPIKRVKAAHRVLQHHGDAAATHSADLFVGFGEEILALEANVSADFEVLVQQPKYGFAGHRFA